MCIGQAKQTVVGQCGAVTVLMSS